MELNQSEKEDDLTTPLPKSTVINQEKKDTEITYGNEEIYDRCQTLESLSRGSGEDCHETRQREVAYAIKELGGVTGKVIVETGPGQGDGMEILLKAGAKKVIGLELSPALAEAAKKKLAGHQAACSVLNTNMKNIKNTAVLKPEIICNFGETFMYLNPSEQLEYFKNCYDILPTGGQMVIQFRYTPENAENKITNPIEDLEEISRGDLEEIIYRYERLHEKKAKDQASPEELRDLKAMINELQNKLGPDTVPLEQLPMNYGGIHNTMSGDRLYYFRSYEDKNPNLDKKIPATILQQQSEHPAEEIRTNAFHRLFLPGKTETKTYPILSTGVMYEYAHLGSQKKTKQAGEIIDILLREAGFKNIRREGQPYQTDCANHIGLIIAKK